MLHLQERPLSCDSSSASLCVLESTLSTTLRDRKTDASGCTPTVNTSRLVPDDVDMSQSTQMSDSKSEFCDGCRAIDSEASFEQSWFVYRWPWVHRNASGDHELGTIAQVRRSATRCALCRLASRLLARGPRDSGQPGACDSHNDARSRPEGYHPRSQVFINMNYYGTPRRVLDNATMLTIRVDVVSHNNTSTYMRHSWIIFGFHASDTHDTDSAPIEHRIAIGHIDLVLVKEWLRDCEINHEHDSNDADASMDGRIKLIDVFRRQVVWADTKHRYIALSYAWGVPEQNFYNETIHVAHMESAAYATSELITDQPAALVHGQLPRLLEDSIFLCKKNGRAISVDRCAMYQPVR